VSAVLLQPDAAGPLESALAIDCAGTRLWGVLTRPPQGVAPAPQAVLIAVGGPQYRVGSHRQFVQLARALARQGFASLRFDFRGMGDSDGEQRPFERVADDLHAGIAALAAACPQSPRIVVWGLCDAASAALMFAGADARVAGLALANPWVRSAASLGAARVKHYYGARLLQREFWTKLLRGRIDWSASFAALADNLRQAGRHRRGNPTASTTTFQNRMAQGLAGFRGRVLLLVGTADLTALEFLQYVGADPAWRGLLSAPTVERIDIDAADHTFSRRVWAEQVEAQTIAWLRRLDDDAVRPADTSRRGAA
jgi:exosortase A-associated hydrolase 1